MIYLSKPVIEEDDISSITETLQSGMISGGKLSIDFAEQFKCYIGQPYACTTSSGTTALMTIINSLGIKKKSKIITTSLSFIATLNSILCSEYIPLFADIDENSFNISSKSIEEIIKQNTDVKAILIVHLNGKCCEMDEILYLVNKYNLLLIEDCSQAIGAKYKNKRAGSFGHAAAFSFYASKNITTGEGGMCLFKNKKYYEKANKYINHGMDNSGKIVELGYNFRMSNIHASLGISQFKKLEKNNLRRNEIATIYRQKIKNHLITIPYEDENFYNVYYDFPILLKNFFVRQKFIKYMNSRLIETRIHYSYLLSEVNYIGDLCNLNNKNAQDIISRIISIPMHPLLKSEELDHICNTINNFICEDIENKCTI